MNKYLKSTIILLSFVAFATYVVGIYLSNIKSLGSIEATKLRDQASAISEDNMELQSEVLALSSYNTIASRAGELGYQKTTTFVSLYDPIEVARLR